MEYNEKNHLNHEPTDEAKGEFDGNIHNDKSNEDFVCGIGSFRPQWIQRFASTRAFLVLFCILGIFEGAAFTYMIGVLSSWEKRYAFDSKISGVIMIADNISAIFISIFVGHYGSHAHRPRWVAYGMMVVSFSCFLSSTPYFIYGPGLHLLERNVVQNKTQLQMCQATESHEDICETGTSMTNVAIVIFFFANFLNGFGYTAYYTVGTAYIDDSVKKKNSPMYFSTQMSVRLIGPSFGYVLASFSLQFYENPLYDPGLTTKDPRWVGAWWMGFIILGVLLLVFSLPMLLFPKQLRDQSRNPNYKKSDEQKPPKFKEIPSTFYRILSNPIWVFHTLAVVFHVNGYMGYFILMPRYMEAHFRQTASGASFFSGATSIVMMIVGIMIGGIVISRLRPRPRRLTAYMTLVTLTSALAMFAALFFACPSLNIVGNVNENGLIDLENQCNSNCGCTTKAFQPVCSRDGSSTYFSPCYAGCKDKIEASGNDTVLLDCSCERESPGEMVNLISGYCPFDCSLFLPYILVLSISKMIGSTGRVGSMLVMLRCVDAQDKNLSLGGFGAVLSAFAFIPYPLVFGALADSTCLVWEDKCGKRGNCWVYDVHKLRYTMHSASLILILIAGIFDGVVCYYSKRLDGLFYDDPVEDKSDEDSQIPLKKLNTTYCSSPTELGDTYVPTQRRSIGTSKENLSGF